MLESKEIKKEIQTLALTYEKVNTEIAELENKKNVLKNKIQKLLQKSKIDSIDLDRKSEKLLRIQLVHKKKINYDVFKLEKICEQKGEDVIDLVIKKIVDEKGLDTAYNEGLLSYKEIEKCIQEIKDSSYLLIKRVKKEIKNDIEGKHIA